MIKDIIMKVGYALIAFGFSANYENITKYYNSWQWLFKNCKKGMPLITPSLTICNLARGRIDCVIDFKKCRWTSF